MLQWMKEGLEYALELVCVSKVLLRNATPQQCMGFLSKVPSYMEAHAIRRHQSPNKSAIALYLTSHAFL